MQSISAYSSRAAAKAIETPALDGAEGMESMSKSISAILYSPRLINGDESPLAVKTEHDEDFIKPFDSQTLDSQTLDLNTVRVLRGRPESEICQDFEIGPGAPGERCLTDLSGITLTSPCMLLSPLRPGAVCEISPRSAAIGDVCPS